MTHNKGPSTDSSHEPMLVSRRTVLTGMLSIAAMPGVLAECKAATSPDSAATTIRAPRITPLVREHHTDTMTALGRIVAGGFRFSALSSVQIFNGRKWLNGPPMLTPRYYHAAVPYGAGILVTGGLSSTGLPLADAELFDGDRWIRVAPLRVPRYLHAAIVVDSIPVVTGGKYLSPLSSVESFDGVRWQPMPSLDMPRFGHRATVENGKLVVSGGTNLTRITGSSAFDGATWAKR